MASAVAAPPLEARAGATVASTACPSQSSTTGPHIGRRSACTSGRERAPGRGRAGRRGRRRAHAPPGSPADADRAATVVDVVDHRHLVGRHEGAGAATRAEVALRHVEDVGDPRRTSDPDRAARLDPRRGSPRAARWPAPVRARPPAGRRPGRRAAARTTRSAAPRAPAASVVRASATWSARPRSPKVPANLSRVGHRRRGHARSTAPRWWRASERRRTSSIGRSAP